MMKKREQGVALVLVLWVITLLTVIAGNFAFSMRSEARIAANLLQNAQAQAHADAGVQLAWFQLMKPAGSAGRWEANGAMHEFMHDGVAVKVSIQDESGKIDLNAAPEELLKGLFKSVGLDDPASTQLAAATLDWRTPGSLKRLNGAKEDDYRAAGKNYAPPNAPFETIDELQRVLGMTPELYRKIAPALTIYSGQPAVNTSAAPLEVLLAIPGINLAMVEQFMLRRQEAIAAGQPIPLLAGAGAFASGSGGLAAYLVRSEVVIPGGASFVRQVVGRPSPDPKNPVQVFAWGEGDVQTVALNNTTAKN
ncbi:MAG: general secretion pathway protein GspK [Polaromonas sp.]